MRSYTTSAVCTGIFGRYYEMYGYTVVLARGWEDKDPNPARLWMGFIEGDGVPAEEQLEALRVSNVIDDVVGWIKMGDGKYRFEALESNLETVLDRIEEVLQKLD